MSKIAERINHRHYRVATVMAWFVVSMAFTSNAATITITNTSSSHYRILDLGLGTPVTNVTTREGVATIDLANNKDYEISLGQPNDQGSHWFHVDGSGQISSLTVSGRGAASAFFTTNSPTSLTIGSIQVHFRLLSGADNTILSAGDTYFPALSMTVGTDQIANLTPTDRSPTALRGDGFIGNWKNTFPFSFAQQTPFQLGSSGIQSMKSDAGSMGAIVPSSLVQTNFTEGGIGYNGFRFTLNNGSEWLYFAVPEPSAALLLGLGGVLLLRRKR